jgi:carbon monoxide dehydrogenase subunit G
MPVSIIINRPPAEVFAWLDDSDRAKQWLSGLVEIEPLTTGGNRVGARARHTYNENGRTITMEEETLIYEPDRRVKISGKTDMFDMTAEYRLTPAGSGTKLDFEETLRFRNIILRLLAPLLMRGAAKRLEQQLQRLKTLVENS